MVAIWRKQSPCDTDLLTWERLTVHSRPRNAPVWPPQHGHETLICLRRSLFCLCDDWWRRESAGMWMSGNDGLTLAAQGGQLHCMADRNGRLAALTFSQREFGLFCSSVWSIRRRRSVCILCRPNGGTLASGSNNGSSVCLCYAESGQLGRPSLDRFLPCSKSWHWHTAANEFVAEDHTSRPAILHRAQSPRDCSIAMKCTLPVSCTLCPDFANREYSPQGWPSGTRACAYPSIECCPH